MKKSLLGISVGLQFACVSLTRAEDSESFYASGSLPEVVYERVSSEGTDLESNLTAEVYSTPPNAAQHLDVFGSTPVNDEIAGTLPVGDSNELFTGNSLPTVNSLSTHYHPPKTLDVHLVSNQSAQPNGLSKLLDVNAMIGPMNDPTSTFSRLGLKEDWQGKSQVIPSGVRNSTDMVVWGTTAYTWTTPVFSHRPLYFEQPNLERYGNGPFRFAQPALSSAHFFASVTLVPVKMLHNPPWADIYTLGEHRPGNRVPMQSYYSTMVEE